MSERAVQQRLAWCVDCGAMIVVYADEDVDQCADCFRREVFGDED